MKRRIISILLALALLLSFNVVTALPASANGVPGTLTGVTATPSDDTAGATATYTIAFTTATSGNITTVDMEFPAEFDVSEVALGTVVNIGAGTIGDSGQVVTYTVTDPAPIAASISISIGLTLIDNTETAGTAYTVTVTTKDEGAGTIDGPTTSANFAITPDVVANLIMVQEPPTTAVAGADISPSVTVRAEDQYDNVIANLSVAASLIGDGTLSGTTPQTTDSEGIATFGNLSIDLIGDKHLHFTADSVTQESATFAITPAALAAYTVVPDADAAPYVAGSAFDVTITAVDQFGNPLGGSYVTEAPYIWTTNASNAPDGTPPYIGGTLEAGDFSAGVAVKSVTLYAAESGVEFTVIGDSAAATGTSTGITVGPAAAVSIDISPDDVTITADETLEYTTEATDDYENIFHVTGSTTFSIDMGAGGEWIDGNAYNPGFTGLWTVTGDYDGLSDNTTLTVEPGAVTALTILEYCGEYVAGEVIGPVQVKATDGDSNVIPGLEVRASLEEGIGTLSGTTPQTTDESGIATFDDLWIDLVGNKVLGFRANGASDFAMFAILPAEATSFVFDAIAIQDAGIDFEITVTAIDDYSNVATDYVGPAALTELTATIVPAISGSFTAGVWTDSVTIYLPHEGNIITATDGDVTGDSSSFIVNPYPVYNIDTGQGYLTIQAAIDDASPGDAILVSPGEYAESLYIDKSLHVMSYDMPYATRLLGNVTITLGLDEDAETPLAETVFFGGFSIPRQEVGIYLEKVDNGSSVEISNNIITQSATAIVIGTVDNGSNVTIRNNDITDFILGITCQELTLTVDNGSSVTIYGNRIYNGAVGIGFEAVVGGSDLTILENMVALTDHGIAIITTAEESTVTIQYNVVCQNQDGISFGSPMNGGVFDSTVTITGNTVGAWEGYDGNINGIVFHEVYNGAITIGGDTREAGNLIIENASDGIYFECLVEGSVVEILNNVIVANGELQSGIHIDYVDGYTSYTVDIHYNIIHGNLGYGLYNGSDYYIDATHNWWGDATGPEHLSNPHEDSASGDAVGGLAYLIPWYATDTTSPTTQNVSVDHPTASIIALSDNIQGGIDAALPDDTIIVAAGIYDEMVAIYKPLTLQGSGDTTVIQPSGAGELTSVRTTPWIGGGTKNMAAIVWVDTVEATVIVKDLKIDGSLITEVPTGVGGDWVTGLAYLETSGTVENLTVIGNPGLGCRTAGIWASAVTETTLVEVTGCTVIGYNRAGIYALGGTMTADYHHNEINGPGAHTAQVPNGMFFLEGATGSATHNTITDLGYTGETYRSTGIGTYNAGDGIVFSHNEISNVQNAFALSIGTSGTIVKYNNIYNCHTGVRIEAGAANSIIQHNDIHDNDFAIRCGPEMGDGNEAHFNNFVNNEGLKWTNVGEGCTYEGAVCNLHETYILDATTNWWGDISGPEHETTNPGGTGNRVSDNVLYIPWLTRDFQTVLADNIAYFGIPMVQLNTGWNTFSTPIALDPACDTWGEYQALGDGLNVMEGVVNAYRYDAGASTPHFVPVATTDPLTPCDAIFIRMAGPDTAAIVFSPVHSAPTKELYPGWNLVGLAWLPEQPGEGVPVDEALTTLYTVPGDLTGYSQVVSPPFYQYPWAFVRGGGEPPLMYPTWGYWVFMENGPDTLGGLTFTPMSLYAPPPPAEAGVELQEVPFQWYPVTMESADYYQQDDDESFEYELPWTFPFAGKEIVAIEVNSNGLIDLLESGESSDVTSSYDYMVCMGGYYPESDIIFAWHDDIDSGNYGFYGVEHDTANDVFVVHWESPTCSDDDEDYMNYFQLWLFPDGSIQWNFLEFNYEDYSYGLGTGIYTSQTLLNVGVAMGEPDGIFNTPEKSYMISGEYMP